MTKVQMPDGKILEVEQIRVKEILKALHLNENEVLVARGDELLTPDINLRKDDEIKIISVVSGG